MEDLNLSLVEKLWSLEEGRVLSSIEDPHVRKVRFALETWRAQYDVVKGRQDGKNGDIKDMKSEIYQLIGFFSVFQGVLFQGVSQLSVACEFRIIPMVLSIAASLGTIFGVFLKFTDLIDIQERSNGDAISIKVLRYYISEIERQGKDFSFLPPTDPSAGVPGVVNSSHPSVGALGVVNASSPVVGAPGVANYSNPSTAARWEVKKLHDEAVDRKGARLEKQLENSSRLKYIILLYLSLLGSGFAYVLSVIMCKQYY